MNVKKVFYVIQDATTGKYLTGNPTSYVNTKQGSDIPEYFRCDISDDESTGLKVLDGYKELIKVKLQSIDEYNKMFSGTPDTRTMEMLNALDLKLVRVTADTDYLIELVG